MVASAVDLLAITEGETRLKKVASTDGGEKHPLLVTASRPLRARAARSFPPLIVRRRWSTDPADLDRAATGLARLLAAHPVGRPAEGGASGV